MTDIHIDASSFTGWDLREPAEKAPVNDMLPDWALPMLTTPDKWENYSDDAIYEADKRIRKWIESMKNKWSSRGLDRRYTFSMLSEILGLEEIVKTRKNHTSIAKVFAYYSTKIQTETRINGKKYKRVYTISKARLKRPPYSLKLRLEQYEKEGMWTGFRLPKDDLTVGHARHPKTEANMQARRELGREKANAVLREWRESHRKNEPGTDA